MRFKFRVAATSIATFAAIAGSGSGFAEDQFESSATALYSYPGSGPFAEADTTALAQAEAIAIAQNRCKDRKATRLGDWEVTKTNWHFPHLVQFEVEVKAKFECW